MVWRRNPLRRPLNPSQISPLYLEDLAGSLPTHLPFSHSLANHPRNTTFFLLQLRNKKLRRSFRKRPPPPLPQMYQAPNRQRRVYSNPPKHLPSVQQRRSLFLLLVELHLIPCRLQRSLPMLLIQSRRTISSGPLLAFCSLLIRASLQTLALAVACFQRLHKMAREKKMDRPQSRSVRRMAYLHPALKVDHRIVPMEALLLTETEGPAIFPTTKPASPVTTSPPSFVSSPIATPTTAATASPPLLSSSLQDVPSTVQDSNPPEQETPKAAPTTETVPSVVSSTDSDTSAPPDTEEFRKSWLDALRQSVSGRRHDSPPSRKRRLEEEEEPPSPEEEIPKAAEVSQPEKARPKRKSLALASIAPLPTLPILEEVKKMTTKRKPPPEEETKTRAQTQIDEDELLLSAARIAAESLKNGPKLFDAYPEPLPADRGRRTFTRGIG